MTPAFAMDMAVSMMGTTVLILAPLMLTVLVVGLAVSLFQALTQINEMTLTFVPKLLALSGVLLLLGPWMLRVLVDYTTRIIEYMPQVVR
jgi:flagellar biosynthetic protein FliQ